MQQPLELRKLRDFGQVINDSFTFLKENFRPLLRPLLAICGFFLLIETVTSASTYLNMGNMYSSSTDNAINNSYAYLISAGLNAAFLMLTQTFIYMITLCYISVYLQKDNGTPTLADVWGYFKYYFWRVIGSGILIFILTMIGLLFCIIPGIYLIPIFYLIIPIIIIENSSFRYAFDKSFRLIKGNWWFVFGIIFIMGLIVSVADSVATIPMTIISAGSKFFTMKSITTPVIILFSALHSVIMLAYCLPAIGISLCYFDLSEQKEGTGLLSRIEKIGKSEDNNANLPTEEY